MRQSKVNSERAPGLRRLDAVARQETAAALRFAFHHEVTLQFDGVDGLHCGHSQHRIAAYDLGITCHSFIE